MMMPGKDFLNSHGLSWRQKVCSDWEDVTSFLRQGVPGLWASNWESTATDGRSLDRWHQKTTGACRTCNPRAKMLAVRFRVCFVADDTSYSKSVRGSE